MDYILRNKIKLIRKAKNISQEQLAEVAALSQQHISRIENGLTRPAFDTMARISKALEVPIKDLIEDEMRHSIDECTFEILQKIEMCDIRKKYLILGYIDRLLDE